MKKSLDVLQKALSANLTDYAAIPFWSWNNELDEEKLVKQIEEMKEAGMGGFIMHARTGLTTEYLGEKWFSCVGACLKKAKELGMNAWVYDENGWPSGFVGGKLLETEAYRAQFLRYAVASDFDENAFGVYVDTPDGFVRVYEKAVGVSEYHCVYLHTSPANSDILDPAVVDEFIRLTHEEYYKRFKDSFGKELAGFFTDEPQYYRAETPYPRTIKKAFEEKYGEDVVDGLVYLFLHDERGYAFREKYYQTCNELYVQNFYKKLYDWCEAHNCKLTGHSVEEPSLHTQMWGGAACMPSYAFEHIPGVDCLCRDCGTDLAPKQVGSVASQLGIKQVLTETFGCAGYDVTPEELKSLGEYQYFNGVSLMCHHLYPYSLSGQGKHDHPPVFSKHGNWWKGFRAFNDHFTKLGYIVSNTKENYDVLVVHPMRSVYLEYIRREDRNSVQQLENDFAAFLQKLRANGVQYQLADEWMLETYGNVAGDTLTIGECAYDKVIVPKMPNISRKTLETLQKYTGKLLVEGEISYVDGVKENVSLSSNITFDEIVAQAKLGFKNEDGLTAVTSRSGEIGDFVFIKNYSRTQSSHVQMQGVAEAYKAIDLETYELKNISNDYTLPACGSLILFKDEDAKDEAKTEIVENITSQFAVTGISENFLVLDYGQISYDGKTFEERLPLPQVFENLLRKDYKGKLFIKHVFTAHDVMPMSLVMEKGKWLSAKLNGTPLVFTESAFDFNFIQADISSAVKQGENEFVYEVDYYQHDGVYFALFDPLATESLRNCLYYDTHIENVYVKGDFVVNNDFSLSARKALPAISSAIYQDGYPFFKGELTIEGTYDYDGVGERTLSLSGRFASAEISINGKELVMAMQTQKDVGRYLTKGKNDVRIVLKSSLRNLFGPHHIKGCVEPMGVGPGSFTMRGSWKDGVSAGYTHDYQSVPFGVDVIAMIK